MVTVQVTMRDQYGRTVLIPANDKAKLLAEIAGTKTLTHHTLCLAERMGMRIETVGYGQWVSS